MNSLGKAGVYTLDGALIGGSVAAVNSGAEYVLGDVTSEEYLKTVCTASVAGAAAGLTAYGVEKLVGSVANTASNIKQTETGLPKTVDPVGDIPAQQTVTGTSAEKSASEFKYEHNPSENPKVLQDAIEDPNAVYGYSPNPESESIGKYASNSAEGIDWSDSEKVQVYRERRITYHNENDSIDELIIKMEKEGCSAEDIARAANNQRNTNRINDYIQNNDLNGLSRVKQRNLTKYGNEFGPTADQLYERYGSWEKVIEKSKSANAGMDASCGLYDEYFHLYE